MLNFEKILKKRSQCILFQAEAYVDGKLGWIGGNLPEVFNSYDGFFETHRKDYWFYLTIVNPFNPLKMYSIFVPRDYNKLLQNKYPMCSIMLIEHIVSSESKNIDFTNGAITKHQISRGSIEDNVECFLNADGEVAWISNGQVIHDYEMKTKPFLIKFGGKPELIQWESYYSDELHKDSYEFLFQIDEQGYPEDTKFIKGNWPFNFGAVYIYAKISNDSIINPCVGYWQFS